RYRDQAAAEAPEVDLIVERDLYAALATLLVDHTWVAVETHDLSVDAHTGLVGLLAERQIGTESLRRAVEELREVKDSSEIEAIRQACEISLAALTGVHQGPLEGRTESAIARDLEWRMYAHGAEAIGFDTIVASGPNSAIPHHSPGERVVRRG